MVVPGSSPSGVCLLRGVNRWIVRRDYSSFPSPVWGCPGPLSSGEVAWNKERARCRAQPEGVPKPWVTLSSFQDPCDPHDHRDPEHPSAHIPGGGGGGWKFFFFLPLFFQNLLEQRRRKGSCMQPGESSQTDAGGTSSKASRHRAATGRAQP